MVFGRTQDCDYVCNRLADADLVLDRPGGRAEMRMIALATTVLIACAAAPRPSGTVSIRLFRAAGVAGPRRDRRRA